MLNHIGTNKIETDRLLLRKVTMDDVHSIFNNWAKDPENVKYVTWQAHKSIEETKKIVSSWISEYENLNCYRWMITLKETNEVIGGIDVVMLFESFECCEIGYILSKKYWNKGIMTEAFHEVLKYLFKKVGFHRIQAKHHVANPASGRVMEKNGLKYEGILRKICKNNNGVWVDAALYSIIDNEFSE